MTPSVGTRGPGSSREFPYAERFVGRNRQVASETRIPIGPAPCPGPRIRGARLYSGHGNHEEIGRARARALGRGGGRRLGGGGLVRRGTGERRGARRGRRRASGLIRVLEPLGRFALLSGDGDPGRGLLARLRVLAAAAAGRGAPAAVARRVGRAARDRVAAPRTGERGRAYSGARVHARGHGHGLGRCGGRRPVAQHDRRRRRCRVGAHRHGLPGARRLDDRVRARQRERALHRHGRGLQPPDGREPARGSGDAGQLRDRDPQVGRRWCDVDEEPRLVVQPEARRVGGSGRSDRRERRLGGDDGRHLQVHRLRKRAGSRS